MVSKSKVQFQDKWLSVSIKLVITFKTTRYYKAYEHIFCKLSQSFVRIYFPKKLTTLVLSKRSILSQIVWKLLIVLKKTTKYSAEFGWYDKLDQPACVIFQFLKNVSHYIWILETHFFCNLYTCYTLFNNNIITLWTKVL